MVRVDRTMPRAMEVGFYAAGGEGGFVPASRTDAWCWQQGCRLAWAPWLGAGHVAFNILGRGGAAAVAYDLDSRRETARFARPLYALAAGGRYGLSLNFARLQRLRPGYGYTGIVDDSAGTAMPGGDGVWLVDLQRNEARLLHSLAEVAAVEPQESMAGAVHYFNHLAWNPSGTRFLMFHIWERPDARRSIRLLTSDSEGNLRLVTNERLVSHYCWIDDENMLLFAEIGGTQGYYEVQDRPLGQRDACRSESMPARDGHPSWNAAAGYVLFDSLPDRLSERTLMTHRPGDPRPRVLASFYSPPSLAGERRCDLHPRCSEDGRQIAIDTAHAGYRQMAIITDDAL